MQVRFWGKLNELRSRFLAPALKDAVAGANVVDLDRDLRRVAGRERVTVVAADGLRGEAIFATPYLLRIRPELLGYYRLLLGLSQKELYGKGGYGRFRVLEEENRLPDRLIDGVPELCERLVETAWALYSSARPLGAMGIHELQLLTIGPQLRGAESNLVGSSTVADVFELFRVVLGDHVVSVGSGELRVINAARRRVDIVFGADPDIAIAEHLPTGRIPLVSVEIKGGADASNVHNRIGEAEKSHQKAKAAGYTQFWTILRADINPDAASRESPTTTRFFRLGQILDPGSEGYSAIRDCLHQAVGIATQCARRRARARRGA